MSDLTKLSVKEAAGAIAGGDIKAEDYANALLRQIELNESLNAFLSIDQEQVRASARAVDVKRSRGELLGPLVGIPLAIKDNIETAGQITTAGSPLLKTYEPIQNAAVLEPLLSAGALVLGKTNLHELAYGITSNNPFRGPVRNPFDRNRIAGGSSGGSAAAVAAGMAPAALGTDTGGSIRIPAALCGLVGFRPSRDLWSEAGVVPISSTRDTIGPITRTVEDAALLHEVVTGQEAVVSKPLSKLRIAIPRDPFWKNLDPEVEALCSDALGKLRDLGVTLIAIDAPDIETLTNRSAFPIALYESAKEIPAFFRARGLAHSIYDFETHAAGEDVRTILSYLLGDLTELEKDYRHAMEVARPALSKLYADLFKEHAFDALIFPTTPAPAPLLGDDETFLLNGRHVPTFQTFVRNTGPSTIVGLPSMSLPVGETSAGLPVGIELDAPINHDRLLLAMARQIEATSRFGV